MTSEVEWRRTWKADLMSKPWQHFEVDNTGFLIKALFTDNSYEVLMTDMTSFWYEALSEDNVKNRAQKLNPSIEAPISKLLDHVRENLEERKKTTTFSVAYRDLAEGGEQKVMLTMSTKLAGLPFVWKFNGKPADNTVGSEHLLLPLLAMVGELNRRQQELYKILKAKDKEIDDLKAQGARVSRKHLETGAFDETVFNNNMVASKGFQEHAELQGLGAFDCAGQELYKDLMMKSAWLHRARGARVEAATDTFVEDATMETAAGAGPSVPSWANRVPPSLAGSGSPTKSPIRSPKKSPKAAISSPDPSPTKDTELLRRQALERKLAEEEEKKEQKKKKKKLKL